MGITVLSVVALVASGASPVNAVTYDSGTFLSGLHSPVGIAIDPADGSVYVANAGPGATAYSVSVFDPGERIANPERTLIGIPGAWDVALDPVTHRAYVSSPTTDEVRWYLPGHTTSSGGLWVDHPSGLAFRADGRLFVASYDLNKVYAFDDPSGPPVQTLSTLPKPTALAIHPATQGLYVATEGGAVQYFERGAASPTAGRQLNGASTAWSVAVHPANGEVLVSDPLADQVRVYPLGIVTPDGEPLTGSPDSLGVEVHPTSGSMYVSDALANEVRIYPAPLSTITDVIPASGPVTGGTVVCLKGTGLRLVSAVSFGDTWSSQFNDDNIFTISCVRTPPYATAGLVDVSVRWGPNIATRANAFTYTAVDPGPATGVVGVPGNGQVTVSWTPPANTGGVSIESYTVTPTPAAASCTTSATACTVGGLANGTPYTFTVTTRNSAGLVSASAASSPVTPVTPLSLRVKAKAASYRPVRKGTRLIVNYAKKPSIATRLVTRSCSNGTALSSSKLCKFTVSKTGKVKVRTKGYRNVLVTVSIQNVPKASAGPAYGPSQTWTRTWRVK